MNYFEVIPFELFENILSLVHDIYYFYSLNIVNQFWNQTITQFYNKDLIDEKYRDFDMNKIIGFYFYSSSLECRQIFG